MSFSPSVLSYADSSSLLSKIFFPPSSLISENFSFIPELFSSIIFFQPVLLFLDLYLFSLFFYLIHKLQSESSLVFLLDFHFLCSVTRTAVMFYWWSCYSENIYINAVIILMPCHFMNAHINTASPIPLPLVVSYVICHWQQENRGNCQKALNATTLLKNRLQRLKNKKKIQSCLPSLLVLWFLQF